MNATVNGIVFENITMEQAQARLNTSQIVTAPKQNHPTVGTYVSLNTSQIVTAPKLWAWWKNNNVSLNTSQIVTAPKPNEDNTATDDQLDLIFDEMGNSLGDGVDSGMIHQFDPHTQGLVTSAADVALSKIATPVTATGNLQKDMDSFPDSIIEAGFNVSGVAFDTMYANELRKLRNNDGMRLYPEVPLKVNEMGNFEGLDAVVSGNVSGRTIAGLGDKGIKAIIGDWSMAQWGIIRQMTLRRFDVGDPDNRGYDLAYKNEVAYRIEMIFAFGIAFNEAFAMLKDAEASAQAAKAASK